MAGRFPGAADVFALGRALDEGRRGFVPVPADRWDWRAFDGDPAVDGARTDCHLGGFLADLDRFDPRPFGISPAEAAQMDPQQRLVLEASAAALALAGLRGDSTRGQAVGVFMGVQRSEHLTRLINSGVSVGAHANTGNTHSMLANRLSYHHGWTGPSMAVDVACASGGLALQLAVRALRSGEATMALAGGVTAVLDPFSHVANRRMGLLTGGADVRPYDRDATGHLIGEGVAVFLLKPLDAAERDGDPVLAVIRGVGLAQSGRTAYLAAPDAGAQAEAVRRALADAGLSPDDLDAIEGQGTASPVADEAELRGYAEVFAGRQRPLPLHSVKGALGHLESASGPTALAVAVLALHAGRLPPTLGFNTLDPASAATGSALRISKDAQALSPPPGRPARVGVQNFGYGGAHIHLVVEAPPPRQAAPKAPATVTLSAYTAPLLRESVTQLATWIDERGWTRLGQPEPSMAELSRAFGQSSPRERERLSAKADDLPTLGRALRRWLDGQPCPEIQAVAETSMIPGPRAAVPVIALDRRVFPLPAVVSSPSSAAAPSATPSEGLDTLDRLARARLADVLRAATGAATTLQAFHAALGLRPSQARQSALLLGALTRGDHLRISGGRLEWLSAGETLEAIERRCRLSWPWTAPHILLLREAIDALPAVLRGERSGADVLFPQGSARLIGPLYHGDPVTDAVNQGAAEAALSFARGRPGPLRVLEIGAGTGGTTRALVEALSGLNTPVDYLFTDVFPGFLEGAAERWSRPNVRVSARRLDLGEDAIQQGFEPGGFDLAVAANALHTAPRLASALASAKALLAPGGALLLVEGTWARDHIALPFGLLPAWWASHDADLRAPGGPLVSAEGWREACAEAGLNVTLSEPVEGFVVLVARPDLGGFAEDEAQAAILAELHRVLRHVPAEVDRDAPFQELGVGSLEAVTISAGLAERLGAPTRSADLFHHPSVNALARALAGRAPTTAKARLERRPQASPSPGSSGDIAIIGMSGRFPGAASIDALLPIFEGGVNAVAPVPETRWPSATYFDPNGGPGRSVSRHMGALADLDAFDPLYFRISPREAALMDPQQRLFLETATAAFEDAALAPETLDGAAVGVYVGCREGDYLDAAPERPPAEGYVALGNSSAILAARIAYHLNLNGPALAIDTACSSSLVAVHEAAEALRAGTVDLALAGGVNVLCTPASAVLLSRAGMLGPSGACRSFDAEADGFAPGEAVVAFVLKRLNDAQRDGDPIHGVLRGTAVNQDGRTNGITASSAPAQAALHRQVLRRAGLSAQDITQVEAHGTGTKLGDPIELDALAETFDPAALPAGAIVLGSAKANLGHTLAAAGAVGLVRALLSLKARAVFPAVHFKTPNPHHRWEGRPWRLPAVAAPWTGPRAVLVQSFGFSGTNAAAIVVEAPERTPSAERSLGFVPLSARTAEALAELLSRVGRWVEAHPEANIDALCHTLLTGRATHGERVVLMAPDRTTLLSALRRAASGEDGEGVLRPGAAVSAAALTADLPAARAGDDAARRRLAQAWLNGQAPPLAAIERSRLLPRVHLPTYPFERGRYGWVSSGEAAAATTLGPDDDLARFRAAFVHLNTLARRRLRAVVRGMGLRELGLRGAVPGSALSLGQAIGVAAPFERLWASLVPVLIEDGDLAEKNGQLVVGPALSAAVPEAAPARAAARAGHPRLAAFVRLLNATCDALAEVLRGARPATAVLFPDGAHDLVREIYAENPTADWFNDAVVKAVVDEVRARLAGPGPLQIIEIGAGTGGTSGPLLRALEALPGAAERLTYVYTDLSVGFLKHGRRRFGEGRPWVRFERLDASLPPEDQGFALAEADLVVATNVLHTTPSVLDTARHAARLLRPGGALVLNEATDVQLFASLTFGLLDGWWSYQDAQERIPGSPLLDTDRWRALLGRAGLQTETVIGPPLRPGEGPGQHVFVARRPAEAILTSAQTFTAKIGSIQSPTIPAPAAKIVRLPARDRLITTITEEVARALELNPAKIGLDRPLFEVGLDSIVAVDLIAALNERLNVRLSTAALFEHTTIIALAEHLAAAHTPRLDAPEQAPEQPQEPPPEPLRIEPTTAELDDPIAIIGAAGVFPGAPDLAAFERLLFEGRSAVGPAPETRWRLRDYPGGDAWCNRGGFLPEVDTFDPSFFNMSGAEAELTDPQQRLFLEVCWAAIEDAALSPERLAGRAAGVYVGVAGGDYLLKMYQDGHSPDAQAFWGNASAAIPSRISYLLDLRGETLAVDTACSSSLVALHLAARALRLGEVELAIAGGVFVSSSPNFHILAQKCGMLAPDGECRAYDDGARGFVFGEGAGAVVLKRLSAARRDGDPVLGLLIGAGVNQDGRTNGITAPNPRAQADLIREVQRRAKVTPESVSFIEGHGTGTRLGDPVEVEALHAVFRRDGQAPGSIALGSVKPTIGHATTAAGIASVLKVILALRQRRIPATLNHSAPNRLVDWANSPFFVNRVAVPWTPPPGAPLRAGISSFGLAGTNAHVILQEAPAEARTARPAQTWQLLPLSARRPEALQTLISRLAEVVAEGKIALCDLAETWQQGRRAFERRAAFIATDLADLGQKLRAHLAGAPPQVDGAPEAMIAAARAFEAGEAVDWSSLGPTGGRRVSAPTTPFVRSRHWMPQATRPALTPPALTEPSTGALIYTPRWEERPAPAPQSPRGPLVVFDHDGALAEALRQRGFGPVTWVEPGPFFSERGPDHLTAPPGERSSLNALLNRLTAEGRAPAPIVFAWTAGPVGAPQRELDLGLRSLLGLHAAGARGRLLVVIGPQTGSAAPLRAALPGLLRGLSSEAPETQATALFLERTLSATTLAQHVQAELGGDAQEVSLGDTRRVRAYAERGDVDTSNPALDGALAASLSRAGGVALITGGGGGLALVFARWLGAMGLTVVLVGRDAASAQRDRLASLSAEGLRVRWIRADLSRPDAVTRAVAEARALGPLTVVVHGAGVSRDRLAADKPPGEVDEVVGGKALGALALDEATAADPLALFLMLGSIVSDVGNPGQADYAFANAVLNDLAMRREAARAAGQRSGRTLTVGWPQWEDGGMRPSDEELAAVAARVGAGAMPSAAGLAVLAGLLRLGLSGALVAWGDRSRLRGFLGGALGLSAQTPHQAPALAPVITPVVPSAEAVETFCREGLAELLKLPQDAIEGRAFAELGLDSVLITRFTARLGAWLGEEVSNGLLFRTRDLRALVNALMEEHGPALSRRLAAPAPVAEPTTPSALSHNEPLAIVGLAGRYPGADDLGELWRLLVEGKDAVTEIPKDRWGPDFSVEPDPDRAAATGKSYCRSGGFLRDIDAFDARFFQISPREAERMDPQERLFLETAAAALEDAGLPPTRLASADGKRRVGVFVGVTSLTYHLWGPELQAAGQVAFPGALPWSVANRVSYAFDLVGPSLPVDTACSSSLVALHLAAQSLRRGECDVAIVGGVNLYCHPSKFLGMCATRMLSPTGHCHPFGPGDGFAPAEGVGAIVLKRASDAERDGDRVRALVRGSAINHGGHTNGYTVPDPDAQAAVIRAALADAGVNARSVQRVEAHGTGTALGDPVEISGLSRAWGATTADRGFAAIGSIKGNIGHAESAAGVVGVTRLVLELERRQLTPSLHSRPRNPAIHWEKTPFTLIEAPTPWPKTEGPRRAAVSSFGAGGVNAHVILEEAPPRATEARPGPHLLLLSAGDAARLAQTARRLVDHLRETSTALGDLAWTLRVGRMVGPARAAFVAADLNEAMQGFEALARGEAPRPCPTATPALIAAAQAWLAGAPAPELPREGAAVSLPTWIFARERFWLGPRPGVTPSAVITKPPLSTERTAALAAFEQGFPELERLAIELLRHAFVTLGADSILGLPLPAEVLRRALGVVEAQGPLFEELLRVLQRAGLATRDADRLRLTPGLLQDLPELPTLYARLDRLGALSPTLGAHGRLLRVTTGGLAALLRGQVSGAELVFPDGRLHLVAPVYGDNPLSDLYNQALAEAVAERVSGAADALEIGAGTGGTTGPLLRRLRAGSYTFTDVSAAFFDAALERFGDRIAPRTLDVERPPQEQGFALESVDLVVAANVLHATSDVGAAVEHAAALLRPGGWLAINEATANHALGTLTFGLLPGWWRANDRHRRLEGAPLLSVESWRALLAERGFIDVTVLGPFGERASGYNQNVILARLDPGRPRVRPTPTVIAARPSPAPQIYAAAPIGGVERALRAVIATTLRLAPEAIDADTAFSELGTDSVLAQEIAWRLRSELNLPLRSTELYNHGTLRKLAAFVAESFPDRLAAPPAAPAPAAAPISAPTQRADRPVAILGASVRLPGARDLGAFQALLRAGGDAITAVPAERWDMAPWLNADPLVPGRSISDRAGLMDDVFSFDARFFGISPKEALRMDPQQRLFLEAAWAALEDAGVAADRLAGQPVAVYVGCKPSGYTDPPSDQINSLSLTSLSTAIIPARLSYLLDVHGPSFPVDTACSSALLAIHLAAEAVRSGQANLAVAGGCRSCSLRGPIWSSAKPGCSRPEAAARRLTPRPTASPRRRASARLCSRI
ncbi:MAG: SDR family NAD(P)-dependent oxidoreductase [Deltaproteobacteria bacterium]|nr:SDR family NAD(P)-dependent oxidoreductase [Deltaproteobacteria bacterium]